MAQRRMFSKRIIESGRFIKMPHSTQNLYFHLCMNADDDGVVEAFKIMRYSGATEDDIKVLIAKKYIVVLNEDLVSYILDWQEHNKIRADRKVDSIYKDLLIKIIDDVELLESRERTDNKLRSKMQKESELPDKFMRIMRNLFKDEECPICKKNMIGEKHKPSIQHNKPISKNGKHSIENISVICLSCNMGLKNKETGRLNNKEVIKKWNQYLNLVEDEDCERTAQVRLGKDRLGKDRLGKDSKRFKKPTITEIQKHLNEKGITTIDPEYFYNYYESKDWMIGKNKMKCWKSAIQTWLKRDKEFKKQKPKSFREHDGFIDSLQHVDNTDGLYDKKLLE